MAVVGFENLPSSPPGRADMADAARPSELVEVALDAIGGDSEMHGKAVASQGGVASREGKKAFLGSPPIRTAVFLGSIWVRINSVLGSVADFLGSF